MYSKCVCATFLLVSLFSVSSYAEDRQIPNQLIDYPGFVKIAQEASHLRQTHRITEEDFIEMAEDPNTIILDTRSAEKYRKLHIAGAAHLNFSDITKDSLERLIPSKEMRILIYCNNNFLNAPQPFPSKLARAALNIPTFITLYEYGYRNVYELGPLLDSKTTKLRLEGTATQRTQTKGDSK